jgi:hypothetical protein
VKGNFHAGFGEKHAETRLWQRKKVRCVLTLSVYAGRRGNDWQRSLDRLHRLETSPITVIGVYLGHSESDREKLGQLFRWLTVTTGEELSDRLGDLLQALL